MIDTILLEIIMVLLLVWVFENRVLPQVIMIFLNLTIIISTIASSTDIRADIPYLLLFTVIIIYSALQIQKRESD